jgi:hypothetical protein
MYVLPKLENCISIIANFDLWMSKGAHDIFALVIKFLKSNWHRTLKNDYWVV